MKKTVLALGLASSLIFGSLGFASGDLENINREPIQITNIVSKKNIKIKNNLIEKNEGNIDIRMDLPIISGLKDRKFQEGLNNRIEEEAIESLKEFKRESNGSQGEFFVNYSIKSKGEILSILLEEYSSNSSMANGVNRTRSYNINTSSNDYLELKDLFIEGSNYKEKIDKTIDNEINKNKDIYFQGGEGFIGVKDDEKFFIDKELNLVIVYDQDEIAPHSTGVVKFKIESDILKDIVDLSATVKNTNYENNDYRFGFRIPKVWKDRVEVKEVKNPKTGLFQVNFIYKPQDINLKEAKLMSLKVRDINDSSLDKDEYELGKEDYKYSVVYYNLKESPYKKGSQEDKNFQLVNSPLDGTEDLFMIYDRVELDKYVNEKYNFEFKLSSNWEKFVTIREIENPKTGLFQVDFIFTPSNKKDSSLGFFSINVRNLEDDKLKENQMLIAKGDYLYVGEFEPMKEMPYEKDSKSREEFLLVNSVLDGVEELITINKNQTELDSMDKIIINHKEVILKNSIYTNKNNEIMLPLREVGEVLGFNVTWDNENRVANLEKMPISAGAYLGENRNYFSKALVTLEEESELIKGVSYVPKNFFSEVLNGQVRIDNSGVLNIVY